MGFGQISKILLSIGAVLLVIGVIFFALSKLGINRLPGDIYVKKEGFSFYFPVVTCIIISIVLSIIFNIIRRFR
jgi:multisubunit Na+/H+ antiporter MnhG subunit